MPRWLLAIVTLSICSESLSQDLFESTNSTTRSYSYLELKYLFNVEASPPLMATLLLGVSGNWSLKADYWTSDETELLTNLQGGSEPVRLDVESRSFSIGAMFHASLPSIADTDWIAGLMVGQIDLTGGVVSEFLDFTVDDSSTFQEVYLGVRRSFLPQLEGEVTVNYLIKPDDRVTTADITMVYRALEFVDVALAGNSLGEDEVFGVGLRYTW